MYSFVEIELVFWNCNTHEELNMACSGFITVMKDGDLTNEQIEYCNLLSIKCFNRIETI